MKIILLPPRHQISNLAYNFNISCQGSARVNNANLDVESIIIESDIVPAAAPARPTNVVSSISNNALDIQWSGSANNGYYINYYAINVGNEQISLPRDQESQTNILNA